MAQRASVTVDRRVCIGSGMCVMYAPGTFTQDEETAKAIALDSPDDPADVIKEAVDACPTGALRMTSVEGV